MKHLIVAAALAGFMAWGSYAVAQDQSQTQDSSTNHATQSAAKSKAMKDCMAKQKATNSGLTELQMQTTCKSEINGDKTRKDGNDLATGTQPQNQQPQK